MSQRHFVGWSLAIGVTVPILWLLVNWGVLSGNPSLSHTFLSRLYIDRVLLAIWPSSVLLMADPAGKSVVIPLASVAMNAVLYAVLGWLLWLGINRNKALLGVVAVLVLSGWYFLFWWYLGW
jgi:hypothetical protein